MVAARATELVLPPISARGGSSRLRAAMLVKPSALGIESRSHADLNDATALELPNLESVGLNDDHARPFSRC